MADKIVSCVNLKGGVGKTAIAVNFAAYCGRQGLHTLLVDLDPQTNATFSCIELDDWKAHARENGTVADLLGARQHTSAEGRKKTAKNVVIRNVFAKVDLIPSHLDLFTVDLDLASTTARELKLRRALREIKKNYDIIVCDCPPNLTIPTQNALALSTHYVVPISPDYLSGIGVGILIGRVQEFADDLDHEIENVGIIISRVGRPAYHREDTVTSLQEQFGDLVIEPFIHERVKVSEAAARKTPVFDMGDAQAAEEFGGVCEELLDRLGVEINEDA